MHSTQQSGHPRLWFLMVLACLASSSQQAFGVTADALQARIFTAADGKTLPYRLYIPAEYSPTKKYPLVLFLHGAGERGNDNLRQLKPIAPLALIESSKEPFFLLAPQCPAGKRWVEWPWSQPSYSLGKVPISESLQLTVQIIEQVQKEYSIDATRLYATGLSMGGFGTWDIILRYPQTFAAAIPICGGGDSSQVAKLKGVGIWAFHAANDKSVPVAGSRSMIRALWADSQTPNYTEYTGGGHNSWDRAYRTPGLMDWLFSFRLATASEPASAAK